MINGFYYSSPIMTYVNYSITVGIAAAIAAVLGVVLFFTFFRRKNEGRFFGVKGKIYNFMNLNRFYAEDLLRLVYIVATCVVTVTGIVSIVMGSFIIGIVELIAVNLILRIGFELVMMFIMLCRKSADIDRKLTRIAENSEDVYYEESCGGDCGSCGEDCEGMDFWDGFDHDLEDDDEEVLNVNCSGYCESCGEDCSLRNLEIDLTK